MAIRFEVCQMMPPLQISGKDVDAILPPSGLFMAA